MPTLRLTAAVCRRARPATGLCRIEHQPRAKCGYGATAPARHRGVLYGNDVENTLDALGLRGKRDYDRSVNGGGDSLAPPSPRNCRARRDDGDDGCNGRSRSVAPQDLAAAAQIIFGTGTWALTPRPFGISAFVRSIFSASRRASSRGRGRWHKRRHGPRQHSAHLIAAGQPNAQRRALAQRRPTGDRRTRRGAARLRRRHDCARFPSPAIR